VPGCNHYAANQHVFVDSFSFEIVIVKYKGNFQSCLCSTQNTKQHRGDIKVAATAMACRAEVARPASCFKVGRRCRDADGGPTQRLQEVAVRERYVLAAAANEHDGQPVGM